MQKAATRWERSTVGYDQTDWASGGKRLGRNMERYCLSRFSSDSLFSKSIAHDLDRVVGGAGLELRQILL